MEAAPSSPSSLLETYTSICHMAWSEDFIKFRMRTNQNQNQAWTIRFEVEDNYQYQVDQNKNEE